MARPHALALVLASLPLATPTAALAQRAVEGAAGLSAPRRPVEAFPDGTVTTTTRPAVARLSRPARAEGARALAAPIARDGSGPPEPPVRLATWPAAADEEGSTPRVSLLPWPGDEGPLVMRAPPHPLLPWPEHLDGPSSAVQLAPWPADAPAPSAGRSRLLAPWRE